MGWRQPVPQGQPRRQHGCGCSQGSSALLLAGLLLVQAAGAPRAAAAAFWMQKPPYARTRDLCKAANGGHQYDGDSVYQPLEAWLGLGGPIVNVPKGIVDVTTAATLVQMASPGMKLVLDPLLYLQLLPKERGIPLMIHMTMRSKHKLAAHQVLSILSWGHFNPGYTLLLYDDSDMVNYMRRYYPSYMPTFWALTTVVERADAWRYHVLCGHGGVYTDTDTVAAKPFNTWVANSSSAVAPGLVVGIEDLFRSQEEADDNTYVRQMQMIQWTMAAKRGHPVTCRMGGMIKDFMEKEKGLPKSVTEEKGHDASILLRTGPGIWTDSVLGYVREMGAEPESLAHGGQVADVVILPQVALGCSFRYWTVLNNVSLGYHMYNNSWKKDHFKVAYARKAQREAQKKEQLLKMLVKAVGGLVGGCLLVCLAMLCVRALWPKLKRRRGMRDE